MLLNVREDTRMESMKIKINENTYFYAAIGLLYIMGVINETTLAEFAFTQIIVILIRYSVVILLIIKFLLQKYSKSDLIKLGVISTFFLLSYLRSGYFEMIMDLLFISAAKEVDFKKIAKETIIISAICVLVIMALAQANVIDNITVTSSRQYFFGDTSSQLWGFTHHNFLGCRILMCFICYIYIRFEKYDFKDLAFSVLVFSFLYKVISSRTSALLVAVTTFLILLLKLLEFLEKRKNKPMVNVGLYSIMAFAPIFSLAVTLNYNSGNPVYLLLDGLIYRRFSYGQSIFNQYGLSLFGQRIELVSSLDAIRNGVDASILDNAYMYLLVKCGICVGFLVIFGWFLVAKMSIKRKNYSLAIIIAVYFICGISEKWLFTITYNPFVILLSIGIYSKNNILVEFPERAKHRLVPLVKR